MQQRLKAVLAEDSYFFISGNRPPYFPYWIYLRCCLAAGIIIYLNMNRDSWKKKLLPFLKPFLQPNGKDCEIFTPAKGMPIKLVFEGTLYIEGRHGDLLLNLSDEDILILTIRSQHRAIRIDWSKMVAFELNTQALWQ
jgi:hypothetical protein